MKDAAIVILLVAVGWLAWEHFKTAPEASQVIPAKPQVAVVYVVPQEKYGNPLRSLTDSIFSSLDTQAPNPVSELTRLSATAEADARNGLMKSDDAVVVKNLCSLLLEANQTREKFESREQEVLSKNYVAFDRDGSERSKQYYLNANQRNWIDYCQKNRKQIFVTLYKLADAERQSEMSEIRLKNKKP